MPVRFAAVRVSGYRLGCRKPGVMNGTKCRGLVPDQRRRVALYEGEDASMSKLALLITAGEIEDRYVAWTLPV